MQESLTQEQLLNIQTHRPRTPQELWNYVYTVFGIAIPYKKVCPDHDAPFTAFSEAYFAKDSMSVWIASRGMGGKSMLLALLSLVEQVTLGAYIVLLGGSLEQSKRVHDYLRGEDPNAKGRFWNCPNAPTWMRVGDSTMTESRTNNGGVLKALTASSRSVRGPHPSRLRCFSKDTLIMTRSGWVPVQDLTTLHEVAQVDPDGSVSWANPLQVTSRDYTGSMVTFSSAYGFHLRVTEDHKMVASTKVGRVLDWTVDTAGNLAKFPVEGFDLPLTQAIFPSSSTSVDMDGRSLDVVPFARLLGWWLADGYFGQEDAVIRRPAGPELDDVVNAASACGFDCQVESLGSSPYVRIKSPGFRKFVGYLGTDKEVRRVPRAAYSWPPSAIMELLEALYRGSGISPSGKAWMHSVLRVRSRQLALDVQELWLRVGISSSIKTRVNTPTKRQENSTSVGDGEALYFIKPYIKAKTLRFVGRFQGTNRYGQVTVENVQDETVYCLTVPTHRVIAKGSFGSPAVVVGQCDEVDEMDWDIYEAATGQTMAGLDAQGNVIPAQTVLSSTHHYPDGTMTKILKHAKERGYPIRKWCYRESSAQGCGWLSESEIERKRREVSDLIWKNEFCLQEPSPQGRVFSQDVLDNLFSDRTIVPVEGDLNKIVVAHLPDGSSSFCHGADWAKQNDMTVIHTNKMNTCGPDQLAAWIRTQRLSWPYMVNMLNERVDMYGGKAVHDATGIGNVVHDFLEVPAKGMVLRGKDRANIFNRYIAAVENGKMVYPVIDWLYKEHKFLTWNDLFGGDNGHPPDSVVAAALAWHARKYSQDIPIGRVLLG